MTSQSRRGSLPNILTLPVEIQDQIIQQLPQFALRALLLTNSAFVDLAITYLYRAPRFISSYRYAQFAHLVSHKPHYAELVRDLDLSYFDKIDLNEKGELLPSAGWREFKYRDYEEGHRKYMMMVRRIDGSVSSHPAPSPYLQSFALTRDIPIGGLCHVLAACKRIRSLDLTQLKLASDFLLCSPDPKFNSATSPPTTNPRHIPTTTTGLLFVSDVPKSWNWNTPDLQAIYTDFVVSHITPLDELVELKFKDTLWLSIERAQTLLDACKSLERVDFRGSSMVNDPYWAIKGTKQEAKEAVDGLLQKGGFVAHRKLGRKFDGQ